MDEQLYLDPLRAKLLKYLVNYCRISVDTLQQMTPSRALMTCCVRPVYICLPNQSQAGLVDSNRSNKLICWQRLLEGETRSEKCR